MLSVGDRVGRVCVDLQQLVFAELLPHGGDGFDIAPRLDLQLDALVTIPQEALDRLLHIAVVVVDAHGNPAFDPRADTTEERSEGDARRSQLRVEDRHLESGFGHRMTLDRLQCGSNGSRIDLKADRTNAGEENAP